MEKKPLNIMYPCLMLILLIPLYTCVHFSLLRKHVYQERLRSRAGRSFAILFQALSLLKKRQALVLELVAHIPQFVSTLTKCQLLCT